MKLSTKNSLVLSAISFVLCIGLLFGATFAWYTSSEETDVNVIKIGDFDAKVWFHNTYIAADAGNATTSDADPAAGQWVRFRGNTVFDNVTLLPGDSAVRYIKFENNSEFAIKFDLVLPNNTGSEYTTNGAAGSLKVYKAQDVTGETAVADMTLLGSLETIEQTATASMPAQILSEIVQANSSAVVAVGIELPDSINDPEISGLEELFRLRVIATQYNVSHAESSVTTTVTSDATLTAANVTVTYPSAPAAVYALSVVDSGTVTSGDEVSLNYNITLTKDGTPVSTSGEPITVQIDIGEGKTATSVKHNGVAIEGWTQTGSVVTFTTDSFSPFTVTYRQGVYVARIADTYYATFAEAVAALQADDTIVLLQDVSFTSRSDRFTFSENVAIDLNRHTMTVSSLPTLTISKNFTVRNGTYHTAKLFAPVNGSTYTFENVNFEKDSSATSQSFQLFNKSNVTINFNNSTISYSGTPSSNLNNLVLIGHTGGTSTDKIVANFRNTAITWTDNVPLITYAANTLTCYATFDQTSFDSISGMSNPVVSTKTSSPVYLIKRTEDNGIYKVQPITAEYWTEKVTEQPAAYTVDGDNISIGSAEAFAWFAKEAETANFAGKTVTLAADIDLDNYLWKPILSNFAGTFEGNNHKISNVYSPDGYQVNASSTKYGNGIFHRVSGTIRNLVIDKATIGTNDSTNIVGVLAGYCNSAEFTNITVTNSRVKGFGKVAGIVGMQEDGTVIMTNCSVNNTVVEGAYNCAGFVGLAQGTLNCIGCSSDVVTFKRLFSLTNIYIDVTEANHVGLYWAESSESTNYYAAWSNIYNDYDDETVGGITYIGKCHN